MAESEPAEATNRQRLDLNVPHIVASALAALSVTVISSRFGINGTLIGAALGSVLATVSTSLYEHGLRRTSQSIKRVRTSVGGTHVESEPVRLPVWRRLRWPRVVASAVIVFVLVLGTLTGVEASIKRSLSSLLTGQQQRSSTTLGGVTGLGASPAPAPTYSATPYLTPTPEPSSSESPGESPSPTACPSGDSAGQGNFGGSDDQGSGGPCAPASPAPGYGPSSSTGSGAGSSPPPAGEPNRHQRGAFEASPPSGNSGNSQLLPSVGIHG
jgi:hypothetical protein